MTTNEATGPTIDRRRFVALAGAGAGLALAGPLASARAGGDPASIKLKVGVMTPTGSSYANMGSSLRDGLLLGFHDARAATGVRATLVERTVDRGYGGALSTAQSLLDGHANVVVAGISSLVATSLTPTFTERRSPLVVAGVGAHVATPSVRSPWVLRNSLLYWQASYAAGQWAAVHVGKHAYVASALSDAGYDAIYAFRQGFASKGGTIVGETVTHVLPDDNGLTGLFSDVRASGAGVLYGLYSGRAAVQFLQGYARSGVRATLVAGSLGVEDYLLPLIGKASRGALSCGSWTRTRAIPANQSFTEAFRARFGRAPDPFAALGYDTAALVAHGARRSVDRGQGVHRLVQALGGVSVSGPRGTLRVDGPTNTVLGPLWMRRVEPVGGRLENVEIANAPAVGSFPSPLASLGSGTVGGYINEYLCA